MILYSEPRVQRLSEGGERPPAAWKGVAWDDDGDGDGGQSLGLPTQTVDADGFSPIPTASRTDGAHRASFTDVRMLPLMVSSDGNTLTQLLMLLEMIRYCMDGSREVVDAATGEAKEYTLTLKVRNRGGTPMMISVGDESMPPIPPPGTEIHIGS